MAESPQPGAPESSSGEGSDAAQAMEGGAAPMAAAPEPWGRVRPWWSRDPGEGTGPLSSLGGTGGHPMMGGSGAYPVAGSGAHPVAGTGTGGIPAVGTGGHPAAGTGGHPAAGTGGYPAAGTGGYPAAGTGGYPAAGTGSFPAASSGGQPSAGTGGHFAVGSGSHPLVGTGAQPMVGTGGHPSVGRGQRPVAAGAPGAARKRHVPRLVLVAGVAVVAGVALMAGALAFRTGGGDAAHTPTTALPAPTKVISAGPVAGGLHKDRLTSPQASAAYPFIAGAVEAGGVPVARKGAAVYTGEPVHKLNVLFMGGTGPVGDPAAFLQKAQPTTYIAGQDAEAGGKGAKAACGTFAVLAETHMYCAWATNDSYGIVASNRPTVKPQLTLMADLMRRIRKDVERPK